MRTPSSETLRRPAGLIHSGIDFGLCVPPEGGNRSQLSFGLSLGRIRTIRNLSPDKEGDGKHVNLWRHPDTTRCTSGFRWHRSARGLPPPRPPSPRRLRLQASAAAWGPTNSTTSLANTLSEEPSSSLTTAIAPQRRTVWGAPARLGRPEPAHPWGPNLRDQRTELQGRAHLSTARSPAPDSGSHLCLTEQGVDPDARRSATLAH